ncbi:MAG: hypothetical protein P8K75_06450 [Schleiferiaceae bacterium]|nr:hypothetical protein [Schleiferiaceae bacterium]
MSTFIKWGYRWRKFYPWGRTFSDNILYASDDCVQKDSDDSTSLELHVVKNEREECCHRLKYDIGAICPVSMEPNDEGWYEPLTFGKVRIEMSVKFPLGKFLWPSFWLFNSHGRTGELDYVYNELDVFEAYSGKNGNYKTRGRKDLCDKKIDSLLKHYFCDVHTWDEVSGSRKRVRFFGLPRKKNISSPSSTYHKFTFERTDTHIEFHCDGKLLVCINSSDDLYESFSLDLFLVISNAVCTSKSDNEENLPMFIKDLSITVL